MMDSTPREARHAGGTGSHPKAGLTTHPPRTDPPPPPRTHLTHPGGFTLIELIIVVAIIGILAMIAMPAMTTAPERAKEAVLRENLYQIRSCIDQHLADHGVYPESLEALVEKGYLRKTPIDPINDNYDWEEIPVDPETDAELQPAEGEGGIIDVRSLSEGTALDGSEYRNW